MYTRTFRSRQGIYGCTFILTEITNIKIKMTSLKSLLVFFARVYEIHLVKGL